MLSGRLHLLSHNPPSRGGGFLTGQCHPHQWRYLRRTESPLLGLPQPLPFTNEETEARGAKLTYAGLHSSSEAIFIKLSFRVAGTRGERGIDEEGN